MAQIICEKLDIFYKTTKVFSGRDYPTSHLFFRRICKIRLALRLWFTNNIDVVKDMAASMMEKFDKYWGQVNRALVIATILDPRNKMDCVDLQ